jgi:uncharacterized membrane protein YphA (DoxX/SURF4 family)
LLQTLFFKFSGASESIYIFSKLGMEPWGRYSTGIIELIASILLLVPRTTWVGAGLGAATMSGAIFFHLTKLGIEVNGDGGQLFMYAIVTLVSCLFLLISEKRKDLPIIPLEKNKFLPIEHALRATISQLQQALSHLSADEYASPLQVLSGSSIGEHTRHVIEFFQALNTGYANGAVNYDSRKRNKSLETDRDFALQELSSILKSISLEDKTILLTGSYSSKVTREATVETTYYREIVYNLEHAVHHMAIIKIGIRESTNVTVPMDFGVAAPTVKYRNGTQ